MSRLAIALVSLFLAGTFGSALAQSVETIPEPTHPDVTPGVDHGGSEDQLDYVWRKQVVLYRTDQPAGTIVVHSADRLLFLVQGNGRAIRYGIGVGRDGFSWGGTHRISAKKEWPSWTPPAQMLRRRPDLPRHMSGGIDNPLGARAMYLGSTLYRIHGSNEPETIGQAVSSGCFRMTNEDVTDLYSRVRIGTPVIVRN